MKSGLLQPSPRKHIRLLSLLLAAALALTLCACGGGEAKTDVSRLLEETSAVLLEKVPEPVCGSVGGEWTVFGMARWGGQVPQGWFAGYTRRLEEYVAQCGGVLHDRKYTEYSRVVLAVTAMGGDAADVAGYDLTASVIDAWLATL